MDLQSYKCLKHDLTNEIHCQGCSTYICPQCVSDHGIDGHEVKYIHVLHYSPQEVVPKIDLILKETEGKISGMEKDVREINKSFQKIMPDIIDFIDVHEDNAKELLKLMKQFKTFSKQGMKGIVESTLVKRLKSDKERLKLALANKNLESAVRIATKIEAESKVARAAELSKDYVKKMEEAVAKLGDMKQYDEVLAAANMMLAKCNSLRILQCSNEWQCDRQYLSSKMFLSEDGLIFGNSASNGYSAIIGTIPFESGMHAFRVTPHGLDCAGKEGFGIIEKDKYLAAYTNDPASPDVTDSIIGFLYSTTASRMEAIESSAMKMGTKYYVRINLIDYNVTITGPGTFLTAALEPGVEYYPCFSCGCKNNKLHIKPLDNYDEVEEA